MENRIFEVENVSFAYEEAEEKAVQGVSLSVPEGAFYAVLGQNGSGKSTLAKLLNGLYLPTEGKVHVCGLDTAEDQNIWEIRKQAGMVFQNPDTWTAATPAMKSCCWRSGGGWVWCSRTRTTRS